MARSMQIPDPWEEELVRRQVAQSALERQKAESARYGSMFDPAVNAAAAAAAPNPFNMDDFSGKARMAANKPLEWLGLATDGSPRQPRSPAAPGSLRIRPFRAAGVGSLLALLAAAAEMNDPAESTRTNALQAAGNFGGSLAGGALGGMAAGALTGSALGPIGTIAGGTLGAIMGGSAGRGLGSAVAQALEGSPEDAALSSARKQAMLAMELQEQEALRMLPIQEMQANTAAKIEARRAAEMARIQNDQRLRDSFTQGYLMQQQAGGQQQLAATQAILGGLF